MERPTASPKFQADRIASAVSAASSPFIVATIFPITIISALTSAWPQCLTLIALFVAFIVAVPFVFIAAGVKNGRYTDLHVMLKEQRTEPFVVATLSAIALTVIYWSVRAPYPLEGMMVATVVNGLLYLIISRYWKISIHAATLAGSVASLALLVHAVCWWLLLLLPPVIWSRIHRHRHNLAQGIVGGLLAITSTCIVLRIMGIA